MTPGATGRLLCLTLTANVRSLSLSLSLCLGLSPHLQSPVEPVSLPSSSLIGQSSLGDAPLMSFPALMTKPVGQYLDLTLL